jgi:hypothetical protein
MRLDDCIASHSSQVIPSFLNFCIKNDSRPVCMQNQSLGADEGSSGVSGDGVLMIESVLCFISQHEAYFSSDLSLSLSSPCIIALFVCKISHLVPMKDRLAFPEMGSHDSERAILHFSACGIFLICLFSVLVISLHQGRWLSASKFRYVRRAQ